MKQDFIHYSLNEVLFLIAILSVNMPHFFQQCLMHEYH